LCWWAAYKRPDLKAFMNHNAGQWYTDAQSRGFRVGQSPRKFAIAVLDIGSSGHVAHIETVKSDGSFTVTEMDYTGSWGVGMLQATYYPSGNGYRRGTGATVYLIIGFIYPKYCEFLSTNVGVYCWNTDNGYFQEDMDGVGHVIYKRLTSTTHSTTVLTSQQATQYSLDISSGVYSNVISIDLGEYFGTGNASYAAYGGMGVGPGYDTLATDSPTPGLPDFIVKKLELSNYNPKKTDEIKMKAQLKNIGDDDIGSDDDIETRYYLSKGYKEDSHSEWIRVGKDNTKGRNLDPGETHWEEEGLKLWNYNVIEPGKTYNIVVCVDRTKDKDNGDGDYPEIHKSNNCSTEAVFIVQAETPPPPSTDKFVWSSAGVVANRVCTQITEPVDPYTWKDNFLCYQIQENVPPPPPPTYNLSVNNISLSISDRDNLWTDGFFNLGITVVNLGNNLPANVSVGYYLEDALISTHIINASDLNNNAYRSNALANIFVPLVQGDYTAKVCVDSNNVISETDESDNCHSIKVKVEGHISPSILLNFFN